MATRESSMKISNDDSTVTSLGDSQDVDYDQEESSMASTDEESCSTNEEVTTTRQRQLQRNIGDHKADSHRDNSEVSYFVVRPGHYFQEPVIFCALKDLQATVDYFERYRNGPRRIQDQILEFHSLADALEYIHEHNKSNKNQITKLKPPPSTILHDFNTIKKNPPQQKAAKAARKTSAFASKEEPGDFSTLSILADVAFEDKHAQEIGKDTAVDKECSVKLPPRKADPSTMRNESSQSQQRAPSSQQEENPNAPLKRQEHVAALANSACLSLLPNQAQSEQAKAILLQELLTSQEPQNQLRELMLMQQLGDGLSSAQAAAVPPATVTTIQPVAEHPHSAALPNSNSLRFITNNYNFHAAPPPPAAPTFWPSTNPLNALGPWLPGTPAAFGSHAFANQLLAADMRAAMMNNASNHHLLSAIAGNAVKQQQQPQQVYHKKSAVGEAAKEENKIPSSNGQERKDEDTRDFATSRQKRKRYRDENGIASKALVTSHRQEEVREEELPKVHAQGPFEQNNLGVSSMSQHKPKKGDTIESEYEKAFKSKVEEIKAFKAKHGHCDFPAGSSIHVWVFNQQKKFAKLQKGQRSGLKLRHIHALTLFGISMTQMPEDANRVELVDRYIAFVKKHRRHPSTHRSSNATPFSSLEGEIELAYAAKRWRWKFELGKEKGGSGGEIPQDMIDKLNRINFRWQRVKSEEKKRKRLLSKAMEQLKKHKAQQPPNTPQIPEKSNNGLGDRVGKQIQEVKVKEEAQTVDGSGEPIRKEEGCSGKTRVDPEIVPLPKRKGDSGPIVPVPTDIFMGRGRRPRTEGLAMLYQLVRELKEPYEASRKLEKTRIAAKILRLLKEKGCRFLREDKSNGIVVFVECEDSASRAKIAHTFRDTRNENSSIAKHNLRIVEMRKMNSASPQP